MAFLMHLSPSNFLYWFEFIVVSDSCGDFVANLFEINVKTAETGDFFWAKSDNELSSFRISTN